MAKTILFEVGAWLVSFVYTKETPGFICLYVGLTLIWFAVASKET